MAAFTRGPWFVHDFTDPAIASIPRPADVTVSCDHPATITVAFMGNAMTATLEEARANARLIAAAPELLTALKELVEAVYEHGTFVPDGPVDQANRIIFRAEGSTPP